MSADFGPGDVVRDSAGRQYVVARDVIGGILVLAGRVSDGVKTADGIPVGWEVVLGDADDLDLVSRSSRPRALELRWWRNLPDEAREEIKSQVQDKLIRDSAQGEGDDSDQDAEVESTTEEGS